MAMLSELTALISPPIVAQEVPTPMQWGEVEATLGVALPRDYREFIDTYGSGTLGRLLSIWNPVSRNPFINLLKEGEKRMARYSALRSGWPQDYQFELFPTTGGILPCGGTSNGNTVSWVTAPDSSEWEMIVQAPRSPRFFRFEGSLVAMLTGLAKGDVECDVLPERGRLRPEFSPYHGGWLDAKQ
jgi:hypothetical protein